MMLGLAGLIMRGRIAAALITAIAAVVPLLNVFSGAALGLVTLRRGGAEGLVTIALAATLVAGVGLASAGSATAALGLVLMFWLPMWALALVLRVSVSPALMLQLALLLGLGGLALFSAWIGDPVAWGRTLLEHLVAPLAGQLQADADRAALSAVFDDWAPLVSGAVFANGLGSLVLSLLLARWWQAALYNRGGFGAEMHALRLGRTTAVLIAAIMALAALGDSVLAANAAIVAAVPLLVQGIALVHGLAAAMRLRRAWLVGFYVVLVLALAQMVVLLCVLALVDAFVDLRARVKTKADVS